MHRKIFLTLAIVTTFAAGSFAGCSYSTAALATFGGLISAQRFSSFMCGEYPSHANYEEKSA